MDNIGPAVDRKVYTNHYKSALHRRRMTLGRPPHQTEKHAILFRYGDGELVADGVALPIQAPSMVWSNTGEGDVLTIETGSEAALVAASSDMVVTAIGEYPESAVLRYMVDRSFIVPLADGGDHQLTYEHSFARIAEELDRHGAGSSMLLAAYLRIIIVTLWRATGTGEVAERPRGGNSALLQNFRKLVEMHFREHWPVGVYSEAVGISHDRLHAICTRELNRTPLQLVHERLAYEAQLLLDRSSLSVDQIAESLGFRDASGFSHFFKRRIGTPPSAYRRATATGRGDPFAATSRSFADWP